MAPEQIRGRRGDARTDVYAVGTLLYEMLTGKLPFEAPNPVAVMRIKLHDGVKSPARHVRTFEPSLEVTILRALQPNPRDRHASASELLDALTCRSDVRPRELTGAAPHRRPWGAAHVVGVIVTMALTLLGVGSFL
jgi:eukaryotic-like serine/threonine-protein kinase